MPDASTTRVSEETCGRIEGDSLKAAAYYIRAGSATSGEGSREGSTFRLRARLLLVWAELCGKIVSEQYIADRERAATLVYKDEGAEHIVYLDEAAQRAVKLTRPGLGDVLEYVESLWYSNELFGDDVFILGIFGSESLPQIITSQKWIAEEEGIPDITAEEIDQYFGDLRFVRLLLDGRVVYYNADTKILASDAHAGNFMRFEGRLVPIDVNVQLASSAIHLRISDTLQEF